MTYDIIYSVFGPLYGKPCWNAKSGYGSSLTMEFGKPHLEVREPRPPTENASEQYNKHRSKRLVHIRGQWHLWIYCCEWQAITNGEIIGDSDLEGSTKEQIEKGVYELDGQKLTNVSVNPENGTSCFKFDLDSRLETKPYDKDSEQWLLYEPGGNVFVYRADGKYSYQPDTTTLDQEIWLSF